MTIPRNPDPDEPRWPDPDTDIPPAGPDPTIPETPPEYPPGHEPDWQAPGIDNPPMRTPEEGPDVETEL